MSRVCLLDLSCPDPRQVWLVVFTDPPPAPASAPLGNRLLSVALRGLKPGFRHVLAVSPTDAGNWIICNPGSCHLGIGVARSADVLAPIIAGARSGRVRCRVIVADRPPGVRLKLLFTCTSTIAHLIGVTCRPWTTPFGLHRRLVAMQAEQDDRPAKQPMIST